MIKFKSLIFAIALFSYGATSFSDVENAHDEVLQVVEEMNAAWADQDLTRCLSYFSLDTDFENSYGWSIYGREAMGRFLRWLFAKYPKQESVHVHASSAAEFLTSDLALIETARRINPQNAESPARTFRTTHYVKRENGTWLIWKTRIWELKSSSSTPENLVAPSRFPEIISDQKNDDIQHPGRSE